MSDSGGDWSVSMEIDARPEDYHRLRALMLDRGASEGPGWLLLGSQVGLGFAVAAVGVMTEAVSIEGGGVIAVAGYFACWAAMVMYRRATLRMLRRRHDRIWDGMGRRFTFTAGPPGVQLRYRATRSESDWSHFTRAATVPGAVVLWTVTDNVIALPEHALPEQWPAARLAAQFEASIARVRAAPGITAET